MSTGGGNRQDNRQRGNAAQLLEKYKGLARDTQMQGDRVQTEFYLQFADHYYRVLNESRARYEEQRKQRGEGGYDAADEDEDQDELESAEARDRDPPQGRPRDHDREGGEAGSQAREGQRHERQERQERRPGNGEFRTRSPRGRSGEEPERDTGEGEDEQRIAADILPPSIGASGGDETSEEPRSERRRTRRPRGNGEDGDKVATPAA